MAKHLLVLGSTRSGTIRLHFSKVLCHHLSGSFEYYHEIEELDNNLYFEHIKSFKYLQNNNYQKLMNFVKGTAKDSLEVYIMGHSLGLSDRTMLSQIFESESLHKVKIFYHQWGEEKHENDYTERLHEISRHFRDKGRMRTKIVPFNECEALPQLKMNT